MPSPRQQSLSNFQKAHGLTGKIIKMLENDSYCIDIMQQNLAAIGLLKAGHQSLMENHLQTCFQQAIKSGPSQRQRQMLREILQVTNLFNR